MPNHLHVLVPISTFTICHHLFLWELQFSLLRNALIIPLSNVMLLGNLEGHKVVYNAFKRSILTITG